MHASPVYHSRIHQSPVYRSLPGISGGEVSTGALKFDGVNDYVSCGTLIRLQTHTVCGWAQMSGAGAENMLAGVGTDIRVSGIEWAVRSGALAFAFNNGGIRGWYPAPNSTPKPATGVWFHWAVTWDSSSGVAKFYVNGAGGEIVATATGPIVYSAGDNFLIGLASYNPFWYGKQDDVRIYNTALSAAQVAALYANTTPAPTTGLVGHWKFDDGSGLTAVDSSGNGNTGTLTNGPTWQVQVPPRLSRNRLTEDWSVAFDGVNDYINVAACNLGLNNATTVSVALWIKTTDTNGRILQKQISDSWSTIAVLLLSGSIYFGVQNSGINQYPQWITSSTVNDGNWHHIVCVFSKNAINSSDAQIYIDGALATTSYTANNYTSAFLLEEVSSNLVFGVRPVTLTDPLAGNIKDVRIYSSALAQSDITKLCNGQESTAVPVARWRLNDGTGTTANDSIGSNHGTLTNGPTWSGDVPQWHRQIVDSTHAAVFDGVNDYVNNFASQIGPTGSNARTVSAWFYATTNRRAGIIGTRPASNAEGWFIGLKSSTEIWYVVTGIGTLAATVAYSGKWNHIAVTHVGTTATLYFNGVQVATATLGLGTTSAYKGILGGEQDADASVLFPGYIDDVRNFNRALTPAEIADLAAGFDDTVGLVSRYKLDNNYNDSVGSNNGTESGGVTFTTGVPGTL